MGKTMMGEQSLQESLQSAYSIHNSLTLYSSLGGGFSERDAHSLQDLIKVVQPLRLHIYNELDLQKSKPVGEGGSYRVFRCEQQNSNVVAVKQVKLPSGISEQDQFSRHVCCIKKDLEVMNHRPLADHPNIVRLLGYSWGLSKDSALPFLVTEFAEHRNLRQFLQAKASDMNLVSCMKLTGHVASGLHALHLCGVVHGDVKLENVLVFRDFLSDDFDLGDAIPKISDFGQSCVLSSQQACGSKQSYRGTRGYVAPELFDGKQEPIDFIRCDIWALALLVWETLTGGSRYFNDPNIISLIGEKQPIPSSEPMIINNDATKQGLSSRPGYDIFTISDSLCQVANNVVDIKSRERKFRGNPISKHVVKQIFRLSLQVDPSRRCDDISRLPFAYSTHKPLELTDTAEDVLEKANKNGAWDFQCLMPENVIAIPYTSKAQILSDVIGLVGDKTSRNNSNKILTILPKFCIWVSAFFCHPRAGVEVGRSETECTDDDLLLYKGLAHAIGYGVKQSYLDFRLYVTKSAENGHTVASLILDCLNDRKRERRVLLRAFRDTIEDDANVHGQAACRCRHQTSDILDLPSYSSADGCNALHYLPSFFTRRDFGVSNENEKLYRINKLKKVIKRLGPKFLNETTRTAHYIHPHFPLSLTGTPLAFAVMLGCQESVEALLFMGADPFEPMRTLSIDAPARTGGKPKVTPLSALHAAVSCHQSETFRNMWSRSASSESSYDLLFKDVSNGARLISALADKSLLERIVLHGTHRLLAQTEMIRIIIITLTELAKQKSPSLQSGEELVVRVVSKGVQGILGLGDLEIANEVMTVLSCPGACSLQNISPGVEFWLQRDIVDDALRVACSGSFDTEQSAQYLFFARNVGVGLDVDARATKTMMSWNAAALFQHCLDNGLHIHGIDEDGRTSLHYAITTGFCKRFDVSALLINGHNINTADNEGITPLHLAIKLGMLEMAKLLLDSGADPMSMDKQGMSILHCAVLSGEVPFVEKVIRAIESSRTAGEIVYDTKAKTTLDYGNRDGFRPANGRSTLHLGVETCSVSIVGLLLRHGANPNATDAEGNTALHYAIQISDVAEAMSICNMLLKAGVNHRCANNLGDMSLHQAARKWHTDALPTVLE